MDKKESKIFGETPKNISKWHKKLSILDKRMLWYFIGVCVLAMLIAMLISTVRIYDSDLSMQECNQLIVNDVRYALSLQEENNILAFIYSFDYIFALLIIAIAIAWVVHGVGFHIIKR